MMKSKIKVILLIISTLLFCGCYTYNSYISGIHTIGGYTHDMVGKSKPHSDGFRTPEVFRPNGYYISKENKHNKYKRK